MAKKNNNVSVNALEKYCGKNEDAIVCTSSTANGDTISYQVKSRLTFAECARFVEDVVSECIVFDKGLYIPLSKEFVIRRNLMTYYSNFTMPQSMVKAFDLVMASGEIVAKIESVIDDMQYMMIRYAIDERINFEKQKLLSLQEKKVAELLSEVERITGKMESMFGEVDANKMASFVSNIAALNPNTLPKEEVLNALVASAKNQK